MTIETTQPERRMWAGYRVDKNEPNSPFGLAVNLIATREPGISLEETDGGFFDIYVSALTGARVLNRVKNSYEMQALITASITGDAKYEPDFDFCDWDDETKRRINGWRLTRLIEAYRGYQEYWETSMANYALRAETEEISTVEKERRLHNKSHLDHLKSTLKRMQLELPEVLQNYTPFEDTDINVLIKEIVERELETSLLPPEQKALQ